ncbi:MAG TPA: hypothetical protein VF571_08915 [Pyrinomonadaceae bacterium]
MSRERKEIARKAEKSISTTAFIKPDGFSAYLRSNQESAGAVLSNSNCRKQKELLNYSINQPVFKSTGFIYEKNFTRFRFVYGYLL